MDRVVFRIRLDGSNYERGCVPRKGLAHNRKKTVFLFARLHRVVLFYQGPSPYRDCGANWGSRAHRERRILRSGLLKVTSTLPSLLGGRSRRRHLISQSSWLAHGASKNPGRQLRNPAHRKVRRRQSSLLSYWAVGLCWAESLLEAAPSAGIGFEAASFFAVSAFCLQRACWPPGIAAHIV